VKKGEEVVERMGEHSSTDPAGWRGKGGVWRGKKGFYGKTGGGEGAGTRLNEGRFRRGVRGGGFKVVEIWPRKGRVVQEAYRWMRLRPETGMLPVVPKAGVGEITIIADKKRNGELREYVVSV